MSGRTPGAGRTAQRDRSMILVSRFRTGRLAAALLLALAAILFIGGGAWLTIAMRDGGTTTQSLRQTFKALDAADVLQLYLADLETQQQRYRASGRASDLEAYEVGERSVRLQLDALARQIDTDRARRARLAQLRKLTRDGIAALRTDIDAGRRARGPGSPQLELTKRRLEIRQAVSDFRRDERRKLTAIVVRWSSQRRAIVSALVAMLAGVLASAGAVAMLLVRSRRSEVELARAAEDRLAAEILARRSTAFLEGIGAASPDLIYAKDRDARFVYANAAVVATVGRPLEDILGKRSSELLALPTPEEKDRKSTRLNSSHLAVSRMPSSA